MSAQQKVHKLLDLNYDDNIDEAVRQHEIRKREELRRQREQQKLYC